MLEALVKALDKYLDEIEYTKFRFSFIDNEDKVQCRIVPVYDSNIFPTNQRRTFQEIA